MSSRASRKAFVAWVPFSRRSETLSRFLGCEPCFISHLIRSRGRLWKAFFWLDYLYKSVRLAAFLVKRRPSIVFAQSPPSFCPMVCYAYCRLFGKKCIVDAHNTTFASPWIKVPFFLRTLQSVDGVLVHNPEFLEHLRSRYPKVKFQLLYDRLPSFAHPPVEQNPEKPYFLVILSYNGDEPVANLLKAIRGFIAKNGSPPVQFRLTGNYRKRPELYREFSSDDGIRFLGFIPDSEFDRALLNAYGVIALTDSEMIQQCAVMEAVAAEVPLIASDTETNRNLLAEGAILTRHDTSSIERAIRGFMSRREDLHTGVRQTKDRLENRWYQGFNALKERLQL